YHLEFERGENVGGLKTEPAKGKRTGTIIRWMPDTEVFTDINVPREYYLDVLRRQAVVNGGISLICRDELTPDQPEVTFCYQNGIKDYVEEFVGLDGLTPVVYGESSARGRDREDQPEYN